MIKQVLGIGLLVMVSMQAVSIANMIHPVAAIVQVENQLRMASIKVGLGDPGENISKAISIAAKQTGLSQQFILSLMYSESSFQKKAVSSKNYQGLMQIPQKVHYEDANTLIGARIFVEKLKITGGDYRAAVIIYKGFSLNDAEGKKQADKVIALAKKLKEV